MLNKFVAPELKIVKKTAKGGKGNRFKAKPHAAFRPSVVAASKSGLTGSEGVLGAPRGGFGGGFGGGLR